jgi:hypothetical protein
MTDQSGEPRADLRGSPDAETRSEAARLMGAVRSERKASAVRANGKLGGRPKGSTQTEAARQKISEAARRRWAERKAGA